MSDYTLGIDLNRYRPGFDIQLAKEHGVRFVIAKATEVWGSLGGLVKWEDPTYQYYKDQTKAAELPFGAFFYWRAGEEPEEQVDWFFEVVKKHIDLPPMIDVERHNNKDVLSQTAAHQSVLECAMLLEDIYNISPLLYTSWWAWESLCGSGELAGLLPIWVANWTNHSIPLLPEPAEDWEFWQFTSAYPLPGQPKTCDASRFNGNQVAFDEYVKVSKSIMYPDEPPPPPVNGDGEGLPIYIEFEGKMYIGNVKEV